MECGALPEEAEALLGSEYATREELASGIARVAERHRITQEFLSTPHVHMLVCPSQRERCPARIVGIFDQRRGSFRVARCELAHSCAGADQREAVLAAVRAACRHRAVRTGQLLAELLARNFRVSYEDVHAAQLILQKKSGGAALNGKCIKEEPGPVQHPGVRASDGHSGAGTAPPPADQNNTERGSSAAEERQWKDSGPGDAPPHPESPQAAFCAEFLSINPGYQAAATAHTFFFRNPVLSRVLRLPAELKVYERRTGFLIFVLQYDASNEPIVQAAMVTELPKRKSVEVFVAAYRQSQAEDDRTRGADIESNWIYRPSVAVPGADGERCEEADSAYEDRGSGQHSKENHCCNDENVDEGTKRAKGEQQGRLLHVWSQEEELEKSCSGAKDGADDLAGSPGRVTARPSSPLASSGASGEKRSVERKRSSDVAKKFSNFFIIEPDTELIEILRDCEVEFFCKTRDVCGYLEEGKDDDPLAFQYFHECNYGSKEFLKIDRSYYLRKFCRYPLFNMNNMPLSDFDFVTKYLLGLSFFECLNAVIWHVSEALAAKRERARGGCGVLPEIVADSLCETEDTRGCGGGEARCWCGKFQEFLVPCCHAVRDLKQRQGVDPFFHVSSIYLLDRILWVPRLNPVVEVHPACWRAVWHRQRQTAGPLFAKAAAEANEKGEGDR